MLFLRNIFVVVYLFLTTSLCAQTNCNEFLSKSKKLMEFGYTDSAIDMIKQCMFKDSTDFNTIGIAYKLLTKCYMAKEKMDLARIYAEKMLQINPLYKPNLEDKILFRNLLNTISIFPKWQFGVNFALNRTIPRVISRYEIAHNSKKNYQYNKNPDNIVGLCFNRNVNKNLAFTAKLNYLINIYSCNFNVASTRIDYTENLSYFQIPLSVQYQNIIMKNISVLGKRGDLSVFANLGFNFQFLAKSAVVSLIETENNTLSKDFNDYIKDNYASRHKFTYGATGGVGFSGNFKKLTIFALTNYNMSFRQINIAKNRFIDEYKMVNYYYVDDNLILDNFNFAFGVLFNFNHQIVHQEPVQ